MRLLSLVALSAGLFAALSVSGKDYNQPDGADLLRRHEAASHGYEWKGSAEDDVEVEDEEGDYLAGVYEQLSDKLIQIQPSVDQIQYLTANADETNAEEYGQKISNHLNYIFDAGSSLLSTQETGEESSNFGAGDVNPECGECLKKKKKKHHRKHKYCHKCKKHGRHECGSLLWKWLKACKICIQAVLSCKVEAVKQKCKEHLPKFTKGCAQVVSTCGQHGVSSYFQSIAQVDITAFAQLGFGAGAVQNA